MKNFDWQSNFDLGFGNMRSSAFDRFTQMLQSSNRMAEMMSGFERVNYSSAFLQNVVSIQESFQRIAEISNVFANSVSSAMQLSLDISNMSQSMKNAWIERISEIASLQPAYQDLSEMILNAASVIERAAQYIPEADKQGFEPVMETIPEGQISSDKEFTLDRIFTVISILIALYSAIVQSLPNEQLDRLIAQNDIIISQQAELIELNQEDQELHEVLTDLKDSINSLTDEVNALRDEIENLNDLPDSSDTSEIEYPQKQDADAEKQDGDL